jgi:predicted RecB family nuclease
MAPDYSITPELVTAYSLCQRKAFLQLRGDTGDPPHEYTTLLKRHACNRQSNYHDSLREAGFSLQQDEEYSPLDNADVIAKAELKTGDLKATVDALVRSRILGNQGSKTNDCYEPHLVVGTHAITKEQKIQLAFMAHVLHQAKRARAETGVVVNVAGEVFRFRLLQLITELAPILSTLRTWLVNLPSKPPPIFLNDHCSICTFKSSCLDQAEREDNLSLLDRMTPKVMQRYHKKGIFTVHQLSYLFKPRRQRSKRARSPSGFNLELQALALRTAKTYVHQPPLMPVHPTEILRVSRTMARTISLASSSAARINVNIARSGRTHPQTKNIFLGRFLRPLRSIRVPQSITTVVMNQKHLSGQRRNIPWTVPQLGIG